MSETLSGKVAFISSGSRGIGLAGFVVSCANLGVLKPAFGSTLSSEQVGHAI